MYSLYFFSVSLFIHFLCLVFTQVSKVSILIFFGTVYIFFVM